MLKPSAYHRTVHISIIIEYPAPQTAPKIIRAGLFFMSAFESSPEAKPISPRASIIKAVHGPCPNQKFEIRAVSAPVRKPASQPRYAPVSIRRAVIGLITGTKRPTKQSAVIIAVMTILLVPTCFFS